MKSVIKITIDGDNATGKTTLGLLIRRALRDAGVDTVFIIDDVQMARASALNERINKLVALDDALTAVKEKSRVEIIEKNSQRFFRGHTSLCNAQPVDHRTGTKDCICGAAK